MATRGQTIITNSAERKPGLEAGAVDMQGAETKFSMDDTARGFNPLTDTPVIATDKIINNSQLEFEKFMSEVLEIQMADAGSEEENQFAEINVNGDYKLIRRGEIGFLRRYHVAVLAQAKEMRLKQTKIVEADGSMGYREMLVSRQTYPFTVIHDQSGRKGSDWLREILKAPH